jgi:hypothetical protein
MDRFDTQNPATFSQAARDLADREPTLNTQIELDFAGAQDAAALQTKTQLAAAIEAMGGTPAKNAAKALLESQYAKMTVEADGHFKERTRLQQEAAMDRYTAERLCQAIDNVEVTAAKIREGDSVAYAIEWYGQDALNARRLAQYAHQTVRAVSSGMDIREAALAVAHQAMFEVLSFPRSASNLSPTGHGADKVAEAIGASDFIRIVMPVLGEMIPRTLIER